MNLKQELISRNYSKLPEKYWADQNLCWYLHDVIMSIFKQVMNNDLINTKIDLKTKEEVDQFEKYECAYDWLKETNREKEFVEVTCKDLSMRLLADFLNYVHEVLSNLERGKITIACDLLRKPFKDNLFYLEWILFDDEEISNLLHGEDSSKYALEKIPYKYKKKIVLSSLKNNRFINGFSSYELDNTLFDIRYNYNNPASLQLMWNKAAHLVTTFSKIKTMDFNFIYNDSADYDECWSYLYSKLPLLLLYSVGVVENIFDRYFEKINDSVKFYNWSLIMGKFLTVFGSDSEKSGENLINIIDNSLNLPCENCKKIIKLRRPESYMFNYYWYVICPKCKEEINICRYYFLDYKK